MHPHASKPNTPLHPRWAPLQIAHGKSKTSQTSAGNRTLPEELTNDISLWLWLLRLRLLLLLLSGNLWILKLFEEFIQIVCLAPFPSFPKVFWYKWSKAACKELSKHKQSVNGAAIGQKAHSHLCCSHYGRLNTVRNQKAACAHLALLIHILTFVLKNKCSNYNCSHFRKWKMVSIRLQGF